MYLCFPYLALFTFIYPHLALITLIWSFTTLIALIKKRPKNVRVRRIHKAHITVTTKNIVNT